MPEENIYKTLKRSRPCLIRFGPFLRRILAGVTLGTLTALVACTKDDPIVIQTNGNEQSQALIPIKFTTEENETRAHIMHLENLKEGFGIFAGTSDENFSAQGFDANFMYNQKVSYENGFWEYTPIKYWNGTSKLTTFLGYAPFEPNSSLRISFVGDQGASGSRTAIRFNLPQDFNSQIDLMYASAIDKDGMDSKSIAMNFKHALSRVAFTAKSELDKAQLKAGMSIRINKITVESMGDNAIYTSGNLALDTGEWSDLERGNSTFEFNPENFNFQTLPTLAQLITNSESYLMLIPQRSITKNFTSRSTNDQYELSVTEVEPTNLTSTSLANSISSTEPSSITYSTSSTNSTNTNAPIPSSGVDPVATNLLSDLYETRASRAEVTPVDWKIIVESTIINEDGTEHPNRVYAVCSNVVFCQGFGYEIQLGVGANSLNVNVKEGKWNQIDQNEWFDIQALQQDYDLKIVIPNKGRDDALYTIKSIYDTTLNVELLYQPLEAYPGEIILDKDDVDMVGLLKKNNCNIIVENMHGQSWTIPFRYKFGNMQFTIELTSDASEEDLTYVLPVGKGPQPAKLIIDWGDGTQSEILDELTDENNFHVYGAKGKYPVRIISSQSNYQAPQITFFCNGVVDRNWDEIPDNAPFKTQDQTSFLIGMPSKIVSLDTPLLHFETPVHSTFCECSRMSKVNQNLFRYNPQISDCSYCFMGCVVLQRVPEMWNLPQFERHINTFYRCYPTNLSAIPASWK